MNTRRDVALALLSLPIVAVAAQPEQAEQQSKPEPELKLPPPPYSVDAANIISYTLYAEARGEPWNGKMAVASVIKTRSIRSRISLAEVCLQSKQFTCWNDLTSVPEFYITGEGIEPDDQHARAECYGIAWVLMVGKRKWDHYTHFYNPDKATPDWVFELKGTRIIGRHVFGHID